MNKKLNRVMAIILTILMIVAILPSEYFISSATDSNIKLKFIDTNDLEITYDKETAIISAKTYGKDYELKVQFDYKIDYSMKESYLPGELVYVMPSIGFYNNGVTANYIFPTQLNLNNESNIWGYEETTIGSSKVIKITNKVELTSDVINEGYMQFSYSINPRTMLTGDVTLNPITIIETNAEGTETILSNKLNWEYSLFQDEFTLETECKDVVVESSTSLGKDADNYYWAKYDINVATEDILLHTLQANDFKVTTQFKEGAILYSVNGDKNVSLDNNSFDYDFNVSEWNYEQVDTPKTITAIVKYPKNIFDGSDVDVNSILSVKYVGADNYYEVITKDINHSLKDYTVKYDGDLFAIQTYQNPSYEISYNSLERNEYSPFSFYISGLSRYENKYTAIFTNDNLEIKETNGDFYRLDNDEYSFNKIIINDISHFKNSVGDTYSNLSYNILVNGQVFKTDKVSSNSKTIVLPESTNSVSIEFENLDNSIVLDSTAIQVIGVIKVNNPTSIMKEGELRNLVNLKVYENNTLLNVVDETNYNGSDGSRLAQLDMDEYGLYLQRGIAIQKVTYKSSQINVKASYNPSTSILNDTKDKQESVLNITGFFGMPGTIDSFSYYTILPENMAADSVTFTSDTNLYLKDGTIITPDKVNEFLTKYATFNTTNDYKDSNREKVSIDFNFPEGKAICYDATSVGEIKSGKITAAIKISVPNESKTYSTVVGMILNDEHSETILNTKDNGLDTYVSQDGSLWEDINENNDTNESIDYAKAQLTSVYVDADNQPILTPNISITKVADKEIYKPDETITYTIVVTNTGKTALTNVNVTDSMSGIFTPQKDVEINGSVATIANLNIGESITLIFKTTVPTTAKNNDIITNKVVVTTNENVTDEATETSKVIVDKTPSVDITKVADKIEYQPNEVATYTITVTNNGDTPLTNVKVIDSMNGSFIEQNGVVVNSSTAIISSMSIGEKVVLTYKVNINKDAKDGDTITNIVNVTTNEGVTDEATETVKVQVPKVPEEIKTPNISIKKTADKNIYKPNETITYTIVVANTGETSLTNLVITDYMNGTFVPQNGVTINGSKVTIPSLNVGEKITLTFKTTVPSNASNGDTILNKVDVVTAEGVKDEDTVTVKVEKSTDVVTKIPKVNITKTADKNSYKPNETINYTIVVSNTGETSLTNLVVTDYMNGTFVPQNGVTINGSKVTIPSLNVGEKITLTFKTTVPSNASNGDTILNKVDVITNEGVKDDDYTVVKVEKPTEVVTRTPKVSITKTADKKVYKPNETITYTIVVSNTGETSLTNLVIMDYMNGAFASQNGVTINGSIATISSLNIGEKITLTYKATVPANAKTNDIINNKVKVTTSQNVSDEDSVDVTVKIPDINISTPSLSVEKYANKEFYKPNEEIYYTIKVTNNGDVDLFNVNVIETLNGEFNNYSNNLSIVDNMKAVIKTLKVGQTETFTYLYTVPESTLADSSITNIVRVNETEYNLKDSDDITITVLEKENPSIAIEKTADRKSTKPETTITYKIVVTNDGNIDLNNITLEDSLVTGYFEEYPDVKRINDYTLVIPYLSAGESREFTFKYTVPTNTDDKKVVNIAEVSEKEHSLKTNDDAIVKIKIPIDIIQTGDNNSMVIYIGLILISLVGMITIFFYKKKK